MGETINIIIFKSYSKRIKTTDVRRHKWIPSHARDLPDSGEGFKVFLKDEINVTIKELKLLGNKKIKGADQLSEKTKFFFYTKDDNSYSNVILGNKKIDFHELNVAIIEHFKNIFSNYQLNIFFHFGGDQPVESCIDFIKTRENETISSIINSWNNYGLCLSEDTINVRAYSVTNDNLSDIQNVSEWIDALIVKKIGFNNQGKVSDSVDRIKEIIKTDTFIQVHYSGNDKMWVTNMENGNACVGKLSIDEIINSEKNLPLIFVEISKESSCDIKYHSFFDSSIWNYYKHIATDKIEEIKNELKSIHYEIEENWNYGLYDLVSTNEFIDLNYRRLTNSYLKKILDGHADVYPFKFHSKTKILKFLAKEKKNLMSKWLGLKWSILVVDDHYISDLNTISNSVATISKGFRITQILRKFLDTDFEQHLIIDHASNFDSGLEKMMLKAYDIILVDYNLGTPESKKGSDLIYKVIHDNTAKGGYKPGPNGEFWFMPISVFSQSMVMDLRNMGLKFDEEGYNLSFGADPINTPELFAYYLLSIMNSQLKVYKRQTFENLVGEADGFLENVYSVDSSNGNESLGNELKIALKEKSMELFESCFEINFLAEKLAKIQSDFSLSLNKKNKSGLKGQEVFINQLREFCFQYAYRDHENNEDLEIAKSMTRFELDKILMSDKSLIK